MAGGRATQDAVAEMGGSGLSLRHILKVKIPIQGFLD